jgi:hypothetical protein
MNERTEKAIKKEMERIAHLSDEDLEKEAMKLEPHGHCCECERKIPHSVCIQYPNCDCKKGYA